MTSLVQDAIDKSDQQLDGVRHARSAVHESPDAEVLAFDLERIGGRIQVADLSPTEISYLRDQLGVLAGRCQWVDDEQQRAFLDEQLEQLWSALGVAS